MKNSLGGEKHQAQPVRILACIKSCVSTVRHSRLSVTPPDKGLSGKCGSPHTVHGVESCMPMTSRY